MGPGGAAPPAPGAAPGASSPPSAWSAAWGGGRRGVRGVPRGPPCSPLQDVGGRLLAVRRGRSVHRVPRQVFQHRPAGVVLVRTQGAFRRLRGPSRRGSCTDFRMAPSAAGSKGRLASGTVCGASVRPGAAASRARVAGAARGLGWHRAARLLAATFASAWSRFGGRVCSSTAGRGRPVASGTPWSGPPAGAPGRRGAPLPATLPASPPGRCPSA